MSIDAITKETRRNPNPACRVTVVLLGVLTAGTVAGHAQAEPDRYVLLHSLLNPSTNAQTGAQQGHSVAMDGDLAVVGAPRDLVGAPNSGVVKVYQASTGALMHTLTNPSTAGGYHFGWSVGIAGTRVVVGNPGDGTGAAEAGNAYVYDLAGATPTRPTLMLLSPHPTEEAEFGSAVAISGPRIVVGAKYEEFDGLQLGSAYVFDLASATPSVPVLTLTNPNPQEWTLFGSTVAISGTHVGVGAPQDVSLGLGRVYIYDLAGRSPTTPSSLTNPLGSRSHNFGIALSISGTRVAVGALLNGMAETEDVGVAYVFDLANASPTVPTHTLDNPAPTEKSFFGYAVAIAATRVVVGAYRHFAASSGVGIAYVYDLGAPMLARPSITLTNPSSANNEFGFAVATAGERVLVGARLESIPAHESGSTYVYDLGGASPSAPVARLASASPSAGGYFGAAVAVSGSRVVVGARNEGHIGATYLYDLASPTPANSVLELQNPRPTVYSNLGVSVAIDGRTAVVGDTGFDAAAGIFGRVFVYDLGSATPAVPVMTLQNPDADWTLFGSAVAISGTRVAVGSIWQDFGAIDAGRVIVFDLASPTPTLPVALLDNPSPWPQEYFGSALAISGSRVVVGVARDDQDALGSGVAYVYELAGATPSMPWLILTNPAPGMFNYFGGAVAISGPRVVVGATGVGKAYVYDMSSPTPTVPVMTLSEPDPKTYRSFGSIGISGSQVVVGSPWYDAGAGAVGAGRAYVFDLSSSTPNTPVAILSNPTPQLYDSFGSAVALDGNTIIAGAFGDDAVAADRGAAYIIGLRPTLRLVSTTPGFATLSWTPASSRFLLQHADAPSSSQWWYAPSGAANPVTVPLLNPARFYRLVAP